jgi:hypothetical protein
MRKILIVVFCFSFLSDSMGALPDSTRSELMSLLMERKILFTEYSESLKKNSGLFGGKTKANLRDTQDKLLGIVDADNRIMDVLNRALDYRNFEKLTMTFDASAYESRLKSLQVVNDTLTRKAEFLQKENKMIQSELNNFRVYCTLLLIFVFTFAVIAVIQYMRLKNVKETN